MDRCTHNIKSKETALLIEVESQNTQVAGEEGMERAKAKERRSVERK